MSAVRKMPATIVGPVLRKPDAMKFVGLKGTAFDKKVKNGELPKPIKLFDSGKAVAWIRAELEEWLARRIAKRDEATP
jgi:predicted DNA-binding transcriptional regulator AlpA